MHPGGMPRVKLILEAIVPKIVRRSPIPLLTSLNTIPIPDALRNPGLVDVVHRVSARWPLLAVGYEPDREIRADRYGRTRVTSISPRTNVTLTYLS